MEQYQIFISYRREGASELALLLYNRLTADGYSTFFDLETMRSGKFNKQLYDRIDECSAVLLLLPPNALDPREGREDWVRLEIAHALKQGKNIIPILMRNFSWPDHLPDDINEVRHCHGLCANVEHFDSVYQKLLGLIALEPALGNSGSRKKTQIQKMLYAADVLLGHGDFAQAQNQYHRVLEQDAACSAAYLGLVMTECQTRDRKAFRTYYGNHLIQDHAHLSLALDYADSEMLEYLNSLVPPHCRYHQKEAKARCSVCGQLICPSCSVSIHLMNDPSFTDLPWPVGKTLCPDCMDLLKSQCMRMKRSNTVRIAFALSVILALVAVAAVLAIVEEKNFFSCLGFSFGALVCLFLLLARIFSEKTDQDNSSGDIFNLLVGLALGLLLFTVIAKVATYVGLPILVILLAVIITTYLRMKRIISQLPGPDVSFGEASQQTIRCYLDMVRITQHLLGKEPPAPGA